MQHPADGESGEDDQAGECRPGLVSIPLSFFLGWLGTVLSKEKPDLDKTAELEVRSLTGIGAEKAIQH